MALDPSIALNVKPVEIANPLNQFAQVAQLQHYQQQNALAQRAMEQEDALNRAYASSIGTTGEIDPNMLRRNVIGANLGSKLPAVEKTLMEGRKLKAEVGQKELELGIAQQNRAIRELAQYNTLADVNAHIDQNLAEGKITPQQAAQTRAGLPVSDADLPKWQLGMLRKTLDTKDLLEQQFTSQDYGGGTRVIATPKYGGGPAQVVQGSEVKKTATPGELLTDARARERLNAEMATGTLTPQSLDLAANIYLQTGQLPTGIGKGAASLRSQVMNRATELSSGKPAAELAGGIVEAKQDVAARGKAVKDFSTGKQGDAVRSFNTAIDHLDTMSKLATALENRDTRVFNTVGNAFAAATGSPAPTDFDTAKAIVGGEVAKALTGANMALKDREEIRDSISRANSPAQLAGSVRRLQELMGGQLNSLNLQYETGTGRKDFDKKLTPRAKEVVQELRGGEAKPNAPALQGQDLQALEWAKANPSDPRAAAIKQRLGVR
jgi:hypothetical protein